MSLPSTKTLRNEIYDSLLYTTGAVAISMGTKKLFKEPLGTPGTVAGGTVLIKYLQSKGYLPVSPFK